MGGCFTAGVVSSSPVFFTNKHPAEGLPPSPSSTVDLLFLLTSRARGRAGKKKAQVNPMVAAAETGGSIFQGSDGASDASADAAAGRGSSGGLSALDRRVKSASVAPTNSPGFERGASRGAVGGGGGGGGGGTVDEDGDEFFDATAPARDTQAAAAAVEEQSATPARSAAAGETASTAGRGRGGAKSLRFSSRGRATGRGGRGGRGGAAAAAAAAPGEVKTEARLTAAAAAAAATEASNGRQVDEDVRRKAIMAGAAAATAAAQAEGPSYGGSGGGGGSSNRLGVGGTGGEVKSVLKTAGSFRNTANPRSVSFADSDLDSRLGRDDDNGGGGMLALRQVRAFRVEYVYMWMAFLGRPSCVAQFAGYLSSLRTWSSRGDGCILGMVTDRSSHSSSSPAPPSLGCSPYIPPSSTLKLAALFFFYNEMSFFLSFFFRLNSTSRIRASRRDPTGARSQTSPRASRTSLCRRRSWRRRINPASTPGAPTPPPAWRATPPA